MLQRDPAFLVVRPPLRIDTSASARTVQWSPPLSQYTPSANIAVTPAGPVATGGSWVPTRTPAQASPPHLRPLLQGRWLSGLKGPHPAPAEHASLQLTLDQIEIQRRHASHAGELAPNQCLLGGAVHAGDRERRAQRAPFISTRGAGSPVAGRAAPNEASGSGRSLMSRACRVGVTSSPIMPSSGSR